ncbi:MAG TPA: ferrous iron transport protein B [Ignavibacteriaceae bacterium]|nr:ferrous iron transport protein B [Ignavibacteriaceae bacterium]
MRTAADLKVPLITLVGPPNSGKTTLFNILSGKNYKTVNYPGSTVEYFTSRILSKYNIKAELVDSPGIVSLIPESIDEKVAVDSLYSHPKLGTPDLVITTIDSCQLSRHLLLPKQLISAGFNVIIVLTMTDILAKRGLKISERKLSKALNCDVVVLNGRSKQGIENLIQATNSNLERLGVTYKKNIIPYNSLENRKDLIDTFKEIEGIVNDVYENVNEDEKIYLNSANRELKILQDGTTNNGFTPDEITLKIDRVLLHRFWGFLVFVLVMGLTFTSIFWIAQPLMDLVDELFTNLNSLVLENFESGWFTFLVSDGIISGAGSVLVFVPQIIILFVILGLLEDSGYLARGAMLIDKPLSKIGLNGRSFVPMLSGFACAIPAMIAARTIPNRKERLFTIFIIPLMSCSARLPVYALLIAYLIPRDKPWLGGILLGGIYFFSIVSSIVVAWIINKFSKRIFSTEGSSSFILELPSYRVPKISAVINHTYNSSKEYILRAGPMILGFSLVLWFLTFFPNINPQVETEGFTTRQIQNLERAERLEHSYASDLGKLIQPFMSPIGMDWRIGVSLISAFAAREVFVSSLALTFKVTSEDDEEQSTLLNSLRNAKIEATGEKLFTVATSIGLIVFFIFALQCLSTVAVSRKETGGWKIPLLQVFIFTALAYFMTFITVNGLRFFGIQ